MRYYVYRKGWNAANNSARDGGPETVRVATVEATTTDDACQLAQQHGVSVYSNQRIWAESADEVDAREAEEASRVKLD